MRPVYETCQPRQEVMDGTLTEDIFAAELMPVVDGAAPGVYGDAATFFANTYPTAGLCTLVRHAFTRLAGKGGNPLIRLETSFGGGKTHGLIALYHAAVQPATVPPELLNPDLVPAAPVRVAALSGGDFGVEGRAHGAIHASSLWGEVAWQLDGEAAYALLAEQDRQGIAPSGDTLRAVLGEGPVLVMLDELGRYMRPALGRRLSGRGTLADQVPAFLHSLATAASTHPQAVVVLTLAGDQDAYAEENAKLRDELEKVSRLLEESQKVTARQEMVIRPTHDDEVAHVVIRRLFESVDASAASKAAEAYSVAYTVAVERQGADLPPRAVRADYRKEITRTYPFHPELLHVLMTKTATIPEFQRTRGALRLLARVVRSVWQRHDSASPLIHPFDLDLGDDQTRDELTSRLGPDRAELAPVILADIHGTDRDAHAQELDRGWEARGKPPLASRLAKVVFLHSLTFGKATRAELPDIMLAAVQPDLDAELLREALQQLTDKCWYLHHDESAFWFTKEASPNKIIDEQLEQITAAQGKEECRKRLKSIYDSGTLQAVHCPERPVDVDDDGKRLKLCVMDFDFVSLRTGSAVPASLSRIYEKAGTQEGFRQHKNALLFLVADIQQTVHMVQEARRHRALQQIVNTPDILSQLTEGNQRVVRDLMGKAELAMRVAIMRTYRHLLVPNPEAASDDSGLQLISLDVERAAKVEEIRKGGKSGQEDVVISALAEAGKLMKPDGPPPAPQLVMDYAWPKGQQTMTTEELERSFRRNPRLPILLASHRLRGTVRLGVEQECWIYFDGQRIWNRQMGAPAEADIRLDAQHELWTIQEANARGYCDKCGYAPCRCQGPRPTCPRCGEPRSDCACAQCLTCGAKPWDCRCGEPPTDFQSSKTSPRKDFTEFEDWARDRKVQRITWLEVSTFDRPSDLQQLWTGMQYFVPLQNISVTLEGSTEISLMVQVGEANEMRRDTLRIDFQGGGGNYRRVYEFFHAMAQGAGTQPTFVACFRAQLVKPLPPGAGEIGDLRDRLISGEVQQVSVRAAASDS